MTLEPFSMTLGAQHLILRALPMDLELSDDHGRPAFDLRALRISITLRSCACDRRALHMIYGSCAFNLLIYWRGPWEPVVLCICE